MSDESKLPIGYKLVRYWLFCWGWYYEPDNYHSISYRWTKKGAIRYAQQHNFLSGRTESPNVETKE